MIKKSVKAQQLIESNIHLFKCPVCETAMTRVESRSLKCGNGHSFDIARSGYVNLRNAPDRSKYTADMFTARNKIAHSGFFEPLINELTGILKGFLKQRKYKTIFILDAGCGEGSLLHQLQENIRSGHTIPTQGVGIDISKEGIHIAAREYEDCIWIVGDVAALPFMPHAFDCIINILSPSNYDEFESVLKHDGLLLKVVPGQDYLIEIRELLHRETNRICYSNEDTINLFDHRYDKSEKRKLRYTIPMDREKLDDLLRMTPLTWNISPETTHSIDVSIISRITVDLTILIANFSSDERR